MKLVCRILTSSLFSAKDNAFESINLTQTQSSEDSVLAQEDGDRIFHKSYMDTTGCKRSKPHGHGYLSKYPTRTEQMHAKIQEQALATAVANQRNDELQGEVEELKEQMVQKERMFEERVQQIKEEESKKREELKAELLAALSGHNHGGTPQVITIFNV